MRTAVALIVLAVGVMARIHHHAAPPLPVFPLDWTANEVDFAVVYQGDYTVNNGLYCCGDTNCEVQTQYDSGINYFDVTHNRTRFNDPVNGDIVNLFYPIYKEMAVDNTNTCQEYCPLQDDIFPYALDPNSTYMGQKSINGKMYDAWQYEDKEFGIVFEIDTTYVDIKTQLPYQEDDQLTPFGQAVGDETSTYNSFTAGTPDPSLFAIKNVANCPLSQNCGNSQRQRLRRRLGLWKTWAKYYQQNNMEKAEMLARRIKRRNH